MFTANNSDLHHHQESLRIMKADNKFFSRLLSKETSMANPSSRIYYNGVTVAVPFMWESEPGTPKYSFCEHTLPPLTPPPSYYSTSSYKKPTKKNSRFHLLQILFSRIINPNKKSTASSTSTNTTAVFPSLSSLNSSSRLSPSSSPCNSSYWNSPSRCRSRNRRFSSCGSSFDSKVLFHDQEIGSPTSILCFGVGRATRWL